MYILKTTLNNIDVSNYFNLLRCERLVNEFNNFLNFKLLSKTRTNIYKTYITNSIQYNLHLLLNILLNLVEKIVY